MHRGATAVLSCVARAFIRVQRWSVSSDTLPFFANAFGPHGGSIRGCPWRDSSKTVPMLFSFSDAQDKNTSVFRVPRSIKQPRCRDQTTNLNMTSQYNQVRHSTSNHARAGALPSCSQFAHFRIRADAPDSKTPVTLLSWTS